jgi:hypothetical protein
MDCRQYGTFDPNPRNLLIARHGWVTQGGGLSGGNYPRNKGRAKNQRDSALAGFAGGVQDSGYRVSLTLFRGVTNGSRRTEAQAGSLGHLHCGVIRPWLTW